MKGIYIVGGYPDIDYFEKIIEQVNLYDFDFVEIGVPFNDPIADGNVIAKAIYRTVEKNYSVDEILNKALKIKNKKVYVMTYANILFGYGLEKFSEKYGEKISGLIIADVPNRLHNFFYKRGLEIPIIPFITPETRDKDFELINRLKGDFVYFVGIRGTTGGKIDFSIYNNDFLKKIKDKLNKKIIFGFGIKNSDDCKKVLNFSDGCVIGTEIVKHQNDIEKFKEIIEILFWLCKY